MFEEHEAGDLIVMSLEILEQLELLAVAKDWADLRMGYTVPDLMERYYIVEPGDFAG